MRAKINFGLFTGSDGGFEFPAVLSTVKISQLGVLSLFFKLLSLRFFHIPIARRPFFGTTQIWILVEGGRGSIFYLIQLG